MNVIEETIIDLNIIKGRIDSILYCHDENQSYRDTELIKHDIEILIRNLEKRDKGVKDQLKLLMNE
jgi:hypothetical protein